MARSKEEILAWQRAYYHANRERMREKQLKYRLANRERFLEGVRRYAAANPEKIRERNRAYYVKKRDALLARMREYKDSHPGKRRAISLQRKSAVARRTPAWADAAAIEIVYDVAAAWRKAGVDVHVDHVVPLQGRKVSGLHVHQNLTILPAEVNQRKHARYEP